MLAMADTNIGQFLPIFAELGIPVAFLVPTPTGYEKSIMDATIPVRQLLRDANIHDYEQQRQGPEEKVLTRSYFLYDGYRQETLASLYRPRTKKGDPRIWFKTLRTYCLPRNLLALVASEGDLYVVNLSDPRLARSLLMHGSVYEELEAIAYQERRIADELLRKIQAIHNRGFIPSITPGDPGVGDTLEHALGIRRNNAPRPDYKGIELKATRLTRGGVRRQTTRQTLFTKVPDEGLTYKQIIDAYGKWQIPRGQTVERLQLYDTLRASRPNAYGLLLDVDVDSDKLKMMFQADEGRDFVSAWLIENLRCALQEKHRETFWVKAVSEIHDGIEYFRYDRVLHTKNPNTSLLAPLLATDAITVDLAAHYKADGRWRDHGVLFKMYPDDLHLLFGYPDVYDFTE